MNYYNEIKDKLIKNEVSRKVRNHFINKGDLTTYYEVGKLLSEAGSHYGEGIIKEYSIKLEKDIGKKYSITTLKYMRLFYKFLNSQPVADHFKDNQISPLDTILTWSHYQELLTIKDVNEIKYYIGISINEKLSRNKLRERIRLKEYQRLPIETKKKLINREKQNIIDFVKDPIILNKNSDYDKISEIVLKEIIMSDLTNFLKQLGYGFCYIDNEYKIKIGNSYNYIDILLFNIIFNCYVVVELKINKLRKQDIGQIQVYMNYINEHIKTNKHSKTIGIIVCRENNRYLIKYSTDKRIQAVTYEIL